MPTLPPGTRVQLAIDSTDLIDVDLRATYLETLAGTSSEPIEIEDEAQGETDDAAQEAPATDVEAPPAPAA
jgi:hypothetical protein